MTSNPSVAPSLPARGRSRTRKWLLLVLVAVVLGSGGLWIYLRRPSAPRPPEFDLTGVDAELAASLQEAREDVLQRPGSADAWGTLAKRLHALRYQTEALACYAEAERLDPGSPTWPYLRAALLLESPAPADAIPALRRAIQRAGDDPLPRIRLGEVLLGQGDFEGAAEQFRAALELDPAEPRAHLRLAQVAASRQEWRACLSHLEPAGDSPAGRKQACALRLRAYEGLGDTTGVRTEQRLLSELPEDPPWPDPFLAEALLIANGLTSRITLAVRMMREGEPRLALAILEELVQKHPDSDVAWDRLGRVRSALQLYTQAEEAFRRSLELAPNTGDVWYFLGEARLAQRKYAEALTAFRTAAQLKPTDAKTQAKMGACLAGLGDRAGAVDAYRQALRYEPGFTKAREELAKLQHDAPP